MGRVGYAAYARLPVLPRRHPPGGTDDATRKRSAELESLVFQGPKGTLDVGKEYYEGLRKRGEAHNRVPDLVIQIGDGEMALLERDLDKTANAGRHGYTKVKQCARPKL